MHKRLCYCHLIATLVIIVSLGCGPTDPCHAYDAGADSGMSPAELPCVEKDGDGNPILNENGRPIPKPEGADCCLGENEGTCHENECILNDPPNVYR